ncbi:hypothetical protein TrVFT333_007908 [Trichoderma virens FT-333]|nr:hypothetical protein TrVFT333_007908 [Trichoderma virens FT-333]
MTDGLLVIKTSPTSRRQEGIPQSSDDESRQNLPDTPSPAERRSGKGEQRTRRSQKIQARQRGAATKGGSQHTTQYCTQKCLVGWVQGGFLDTCCPNVKLRNKRLGHIRRASSSRHSISHSKWLQFLREQLEESLDKEVTPFGEGGLRGATYRRGPLWVRIQGLAARELWNESD